MDNYGYMNLCILKDIWPDVSRHMGIPSFCSTCCRWFDASQHEVELGFFFQDARANAEHNVHCLDWFGASQRVSRTWIARGYRASAFDIKLCTSQDMVNREGCHLLLKMAAQLLSLDSIKLYVFFVHFQFPHSLATFP